MKNDTVDWKLLEEEVYSERARKAKMKRMNNATLIEYHFEKKGHYRIEGFVVGIVGTLIGFGIGLVLIKCLSCCV